MFGVERGGIAGGLASGNYHELFTIRGKSMTL
jgi:hypothetical protein